MQTESACEDMAEEADTQGEQEGSIGTSLEGVFKILSRIPPKRLLSLTLNMGPSCAEELVHAMSLILLGKRREALEKLQNLGQCDIARHLMEVLKSQTSLRNFALHHKNMPKLGVDAPLKIAEIFRVLARECLCCESWSNNAYQVDQQAGLDLEKEQLYDDKGKETCGTELVSPRTSHILLNGVETLQSLHEPRSSLGLKRLSASIEINRRRCGTPEASEHSSPTSLRTRFSNLTTFPSHLEVSASPTNVFEPEQIEQAMQEMKLSSYNVPCHTTHTKSITSIVPSQTIHCSNSSPETNLSNTLESYDKCGVNLQLPLQSKSTESHESSLSKPNFSRDPPMRSSLSEKPYTDTKEQLRKSVEQEKDEADDDARFFTFVILHGQEDLEAAEELQERLESLGISDGSTFSSFQVPGKSELRCLEDAIDNSAFTILLLSRNFNTRMQEFQTDSALINAIENRHKYNSVIPLLPRKNRLRREDMPRCLAIYVLLDESSKSFEKMVKKAMTPEKIRKQKEMWCMDQPIRKQRENQERLREEMKRSRALARETRETYHLEREQMQNLYVLQEMKQKFNRLTNMSTCATHDTVGWCPRSPAQTAFDLDYESMEMRQEHPMHSIHIENAKYIMIGDNSQMTVKKSAANSEEVSSSATSAAEDMSGERNLQSDS